MTEHTHTHTHTHTRRGQIEIQANGIYWPWDMECERNKESRMTSSFWAQSAGKMESLVPEIWKTVAGGGLQVEDWGICLGYNKFDLSIRHQSRSVNRQWEVKSQKFTRVVCTTSSGIEAREWEKGNLCNLNLQVKNAAITIPFRSATLYLASTIWKFGQGPPVWGWHFSEIFCLPFTKKFDVISWRFCA